MAKAAKRITKPVHDAGKDLQSSKSSKLDKELAAKILSDRAHGVKKVTTTKKALTKKSASKKK